MEYILNECCLSNIFSFLNKKSLINYDTALTCKEIRDIYLRVIQTSKFNIQICSWTIFKNIRYTNMMCNYKYLQNYNCINKKLIVYSGNKNLSDVFKIKNDYISYLHIDLGSKNILLESLNALNLKTLVLVLVININFEIFKIIKKSCPKLEKIILIKCTEIENEIKNILFNQNINIISYI